MLQKLKTKLNPHRKESHGVRADRSAGTDSNIGSHQLPLDVDPSASGSQASGPRMFERSTDIKIDNSIVTNAQGDVNITLVIGDAVPQVAQKTDILKTSKTILNMFSTFAGSPELDTCLEMLKEMQVVDAAFRKEDLDEYCGRIMRSIKALMDREGLDVSHKFKDNLKQFYDTLSQISQEIRASGGENNPNNPTSMGRICLEITQAMHSFMLINYISGTIKTEGTFVSEKRVLHQCVQNLPHVDAAYNDYESEKKTGACFEGTRESLLEEIAVWISTLEALQIYLLSGIAGIGKSTVAYTVAERAERAGYLGASFFFSRDELERSNAKRLFTTIAFQLCLYDKEFAQAIEKALITERGLGAVGKDPITQLEALIIEPLRDIIKSRFRPIVTIIDALDECDDRDAQTVLAALHRLVQELPLFKIILTTRPQPHLPANPSFQKIFQLQNIEDKIVDGDIRRYLGHHLSWPQVAVSLPGLRVHWSISKNDLESLVHVAGRLFIIASTAVRFILDTTVYDPKTQLEVLGVDGRAALDGLENFYDVILRRAVPPNKPMVAERFRSVIGTILAVQEPLSIKVLESLTQPRYSSAIYAVLVNLQSVVALNNDIPRIYHKSFFDYLTNLNLCAKDLLIDMKEHHTQLATRCFEVMNRLLRQNILDLGTPARFMNNDAGLEEEKIPEGQLQEKIPGELRYACTYLASHIEEADSKDTCLLHEVETFIRQHLLHWLEALSWIKKLDIATDALRVILRSMESISSEVSEIISDALLFVPKFYERIRQSALHIYYSALSFTPTESQLFSSHSNETVHRLCRLKGVPPRWNPLIAHIIMSDGPGRPTVSFSDDSSNFCTNSRGKMNIFKAENGTLVRTFEGDVLSIANDFSTVAVLQGSSVTLLNMATNIPIANVVHPEKVVKLALSFDGSRLAAWSTNGMVSLWNAQKGELIANLGNFAHKRGHLEFAPRGYGLALLPGNHGTLQLWDGRDGNLVAKLDDMSKTHIELVFSRDGRCLASIMVERTNDIHSLMLWSGESGRLIGVAENIWSGSVAISEDGSFVATGGKKVQLWNGSPLSLLETLVKDWRSVTSLAISRGFLVMGSDFRLTLYDINNRTFLTTELEITNPYTVTFSPDSIRLAVSAYPPDACWLYNVPGLKAFLSAPPIENSRLVTALSFSSDSTRLASGFPDGTVKLWDTRNAEKPIAVHKLHSKRVGTVAFSLDGVRFASGSSDNTVRLWDGRDGKPIHQLEHSFVDGVVSLAFSSSLLAAATFSDITLFDYQSLRAIGTLTKGSRPLSISADGSLLASVYDDDATIITVWNVDGWVAIAEFQVDDARISRLTFSPDGSQLAAQLTPQGVGNIKLFDIINKRAIQLNECEDLCWIPNFMGGVLISWKDDKDHGDYLVGRFLRHPSWVPVLWIPSEIGIVNFAACSSMIALGCKDGRILFVRV